MRKLFITSLLLSSVASFAMGKKTELYHCVNLDWPSNVDSLEIYEVEIGKNVRYEVTVNTITQGVQDSFTKRVNLVSTYEGRVQTYGTGNFRVKVDRVFPSEQGHMRAFARIPQFGVHSKSWSCKDSI